VLAPFQNKEVVKITQVQELGLDNPRVAAARLRLESSGRYSPQRLDELARAADAETYYGDNDLAIDVLRNKYLAHGETGPLDVWERTARAVASVEQDFEYWKNAFFDLIADFRFVPGGRIMHGAGRDEARRKPTLSNCYVIPIKEDSLEGIYACLAESAMVYRIGGGVGTDLSILRPRGALVNATVDKSPGVTAFMNLLSESTEAVAQAGRRGALMLTLRVDHPDVYYPEYDPNDPNNSTPDFIRIKSDRGRTKVRHANVSVLVTHEFMRAVEGDTDFDLRWDGEVYRTVRARDLWNTIIQSAYASAEPGIIFWDTMREYHNVEYANPLTSTNPCAEQPLASYTACNLGSLNLLKFVRPDGSFDYDDLADATRVATRFLDDVIEYNLPNHALPSIKEAVASDRRVGLGITALADAFVAMRLKYDTEEALKAAEGIMRTITYTAYETSTDLAREKGPFPLFNWDGVSRSKFIQDLPEGIQGKIREYGLRNSTLITIPPVGTGSIVAQTSSGVEPIFCTSYTRRVKQGDAETFREYKVYHPLVKKLFGDDEKLPEHVVVAHQIDPYFRVRMQGVLQRFTDSSISSTINLPEDTTVETIADIYLAAYKQGLKGVTVFREGSRQGILETSGHANKASLPLESRLNGNGFIHPRERPAITSGITERIRTGEGNLYVTLNEDEEGRLIEAFSAIGKAGGNAAAQSEAISRLISLSLRSGIDPREVVSQLKGISGPQAVWEDGQLILSTPDAIGRAMERYLVRKGLISKGNGYPISVQEGVENGEKAQRGTGTCPECGSPVANENSCLTCKHCGWSKC